MVLGTVAKCSYFDDMISFIEELLEEEVLASWVDGGPEEAEVELLFPGRPAAFPEEVPKRPGAGTPGGRTGGIPRP